MKERNISKRIWEDTKYRLNLQKVDSRSYNNIEIMIPPE